MNTLLIAENNQVKMILKILLFILFNVTNALAIERLNSFLNRNETITGNEETLNQIAKRVSFQTKFGILDNYDYLKEKELRDDPCVHCPGFLKLAREVNKIVREVPRSDKDKNIQTVASNQLEFLYFIVQSEYEDGRVECKKMLEDPIQKILKEKKSGEYELLSDTLFSLTEIGGLQLINPHTKSVHYIYRGKGSDRDNVYEIIKKSGEKPRLRIFRYHPTEAEKNPYNLPDLGEAPIKNLGFNMINYQGSALDISPEEKAKLKENGYLRTGIKVETRRNGVPRDLHFLKSGTQVDLLGNIQGDAEVGVSLKEVKASMSLKSAGVASGAEMVVVEIKKANVGSPGNDQVKIAVPFSLEVPLTSELKVEGNIAQTKYVGPRGLEGARSAQTATMILTDSNGEIARVEAYNNDKGERETAIIKPIFLDPNTVVSTYIGERKNNVKGQGTFIGLQHARKISENAAIVLDVEYSKKHGSMLLWQYQQKF